MKKVVLIIGFVLFFLQDIFGQNYMTSEEIKDSVSEALIWGLIGGILLLALYLFYKNKEEEGNPTLFGNLILFGGLLCMVPLWGWLCFLFIRLQIIAYVGIGLFFVYLFLKDEINDFFNKRKS